MHACGHDFHTAGLLGAAIILSRNRSEVPGTVDFLFQEAEETTDGARKMIDAGLFEVIHPAAFFGEHNRPEVPVGKVVCKNGALMAAKTNFVIRIFGRGGHGSMPHLCVDPIVASAAIIQSLQTIVSRNTDPLESVVLSVGSIHGGSIENLVVDKVEMTASIRALSVEARERAVRRMENVVRSTAEAYECRAEIEYREILPLTFNSEEMYKVAVRAAEMAVGSENVIDVPPTLASEDFSVFMERVPSFFYWIGSGIPGETPYAWHQSRFKADDAGLKVAAGVMAAACFAYAGRETEFPER
jgi:hippurate hydrolase